MTEAWIAENNDRQKTLFLTDRTIYTGGSITFISHEAHANVLNFSDNLNTIYGLSVLI